MARQAVRVDLVVSELSRVLAILYQLETLSRCRVTWQEVRAGPLTSEISDCACHSVSTSSLDVLLSVIWASFWTGLAPGPRLAEVTDASGD